jgi:hypothetical protein
MSDRNIPTDLVSNRDLYRHRLLMVAKALRESPDPDKFRMDDVIHSCGTPACAFGHYVCRPDLQGAYQPSRYRTIDSGKWYWRPVFAGTDEHVAFYSDHVMDHFGLTDDEQSALFDGGGCGEAKTAIEAAEYIERFVEQKYPLSALDQSHG